MTSEEEQHAILERDIRRMQAYGIALPYVEAAWSTFLYLRESALSFEAYEGKERERISAKIMLGEIGLNLIGIAVKLFDDVPEWSLWPPRIVSPFNASRREDDLDKLYAPTKEK
jgi:hypothetical protein